MSTAHLGALHLKGWQLQAVGLLLEGRPEVKVNGTHPKVTSTAFLIRAQIYFLLEIASMADVNRYL